MTRTSVIRTAFAMASVLCLWAWTAQAQQACVPRDRAVLQLDQFEEQVAGRGLTANGSRVLELFVSESGTWTLLASDVRGRSCVMASGESWHPVKQVAGDPA